jgi:Putative peptidoglycan binding domain
MKFGERTLKVNSNGKDVQELQLRLAGFAGTVWDGEFGNKTKNQVVIFQKEFMNIANPTGVVDTDTYTALDIFANQYPVDFGGKLQCPSCQGAGDLCTKKGFGQKRFKKLFLKRRTPMLLDWSRTGKETLRESVHQYEYPGIHKAILHTYRAFLFYAPETKFKSPRITSGYRCHINNVDRRRTSTNHMGKAMDFSFEARTTNDKQNICNDARDLLVQKSNCQIRWNKKNLKALEPGFPARGREFIAATWVHLDVRQYEDQFLQDRFFVSNMDELDNKELGE